MDSEKVEDLIMCIPTLDFYLGKKKDTRRVWVHSLINHLFISLLEKFIRIKLISL